MSKFWNRNKDPYRAVRDVSDLPVAQRSLERGGVISGYKDSNDPFAKPAGYVNRGAAYIGGTPEHPWGVMGDALACITVELPDGESAPPAGEITGPRTQQPTAKPKKPVGLRPMFAASTPDGRMALAVNWELPDGGRDIAPGKVGILMPPSDENSESHIFFPIDSPGLISHLRPFPGGITGEGVESAPPEQSTLVSDIGEDGKPDPDRQAGFHKAFGVVPKPPIFGPGNMLARNATTFGRGDLIGHGAFMMTPSGGGTSNRPNAINESNALVFMTGYAPAEYGGPLVGIPRSDPHTFATDEEGTWHGPLIFSTSQTKYEGNGLGPPAPNEFNGLKQPEGRYDLLTKVVHVYNPLAQHYQPFVGLVDGQWEWQAEVPYEEPTPPWVPPEDPPPRWPPPTDDDIPPNTVLPPPPAPGDPDPTGSVDTPDQAIERRRQDGTTDEEDEEIPYEGPVITGSGYGRRHETEGSQDREDGATGESAVTGDDDEAATSTAKQQETAEQERARRIASGEITQGRNTRNNGELADYALPRGWGIGRPLRFYNSIGTPETVFTVEDPDYATLNVPRYRARMRDNEESALVRSWPSAPATLTGFGWFANPDDFGVARSGGIMFGSRDLSPAQAYDDDDFDSDYTSYALFHPSATLALAFPTREGGIRCGWTITRQGTCGSTLDITHYDGDGAADGAGTIDFHGATAENLQFPYVYMDGSAPVGTSYALTQNGTVCLNASGSALTLTLATLAAADDGAVAYVVLQDVTQTITISSGTGTYNINGVAGDYTVTAPQYAEVKVRKVATDVFIVSDPCNCPA